jgi:hypothetical protein
VSLADTLANKHISLTLDRLHVTTVDNFWQAALNASKVRALFLAALHDSARHLSEAAILTEMVCTLQVSDQQSAVNGGTLRGGADSSGLFSGPPNFSRKECWKLGTSVDVCAFSHRS